jgi:hypothetical protein
MYKKTVLEFDKYDNGSYSKYIKLGYDTTTIRNLYKILKRYDLETISSDIITQNIAFFHKKNYNYCLYYTKQELNSILTPSLLSSENKYRVIKIKQYLYLITIEE